MKTFQDIYHNHYNHDVNFDGKIKSTLKGLKDPETRKGGKNKMIKMKSVELSESFFLCQNNWNKVNINKMNKIATS